MLKNKNVFKPVVIAALLVASGPAFSSTAVDNRAAIDETKKILDGIPDAKTMLLEMKESFNPEYRTLLEQIRKINESVPDPDNIEDPELRAVHKRIADRMAEIREMDRMIDAEIRKLG